MKNTFCLLVFCSVIACGWCSIEGNKKTTKFDLTDIETIINDSAKAVFAPLQTTKTITQEQIEIWTMVENKVEQYINQVYGEAQKKKMNLFDKNAALEQLGQIKHRTQQIFSFIKDIYPACHNYEECKSAIDLYFQPQWITSTVKKLEDYRKQIKDSWTEAKEQRFAVEALKLMVQKLDAAYLIF